MKTLGFIFTLLLTGCTSVFFQPSKRTFPAVFEKEISPRPFRIHSFDNTSLSAWYFSTPAKQPKGLVIQFHGNAENMTTHFQSVHWLAAEGYDLITFDYRGYGDSQGEPSMTTVYKDVIAALQSADKIASEQKLGLVTIGQSLGGSLLLKALQEYSPQNLKAIIIEGSFYSYRQIAREKLDIFWLTRPFKFMTSLVISDLYSPGGNDLKNLPNVPKFLLYSANDPVVPVHHGTQLYNELAEPKKLLIHEERGHINSFFIQNGKRRTEIVSELQKVM